MTEFHMETETTETAETPSADAIAPEETSASEIVSLEEVNKAVNQVD